MTGKELKQKNEVNCYACLHFYITYDRNFPYGCRRAGFKSRLLPSLEVLNSSGLACQFFEKKERS